MGLSTGVMRRFYGLLNTLNYVLILAGPILVALSAFTTYASMVRTRSTSCLASFLDEHRSHVIEWFTSCDSLSGETRPIGLRCSSGRNQSLIRGCRFVQDHVQRKVPLKHAISDTHVLGVQLQTEPIACYYEQTVQAHVPRVARGTS
jgi:hypothetical protein